MIVHLSDHLDAAELICRAIRLRAALEFRYDGLARTVAPYCHGSTTRGKPALRGVQLRGASRSGSIGLGKLWLIEKMSDVRILPERFEPDDPDYNPDDVAMESICCRI
jgi:hypothetical protein